MVEKHSKYKWPNENTVIWRYLDFTKFMSLLSTQNLFFSKASNFEDPFEGSLPLKTLNRRLRQFPDVSDIDRIINPFPYENWFFINCWHCNKYESAAMWKLYLDSGNGIAIKSTFKRLKSSFIDNEVNRNHQINIGLVDYIDYEVDDIDDSFACNRFLVKRKSFEHESELRATILKQNEDINGIEVSVDLKELIESIYISPSAESWFETLIRKVIEDYKYDFDILKSELLKEPNKLK